MGIHGSSLVKRIVKNVFWIRIIYLDFEVEMLGNTFYGEIDGNYLKIFLKLI